MSKTLFDRHKTNSGVVPLKDPVDGVSRFIVVHLRMYEYVFDTKGHNSQAGW